LTGNARSLNMFESFVGNFTNPLNVAIATPMVTISAIPTTAYSAPGVVYGLPKSSSDK